METQVSQTDLPTNRQEGIFNRTIASFQRLQ
jgi:hypothetical protein